MNIQILPYFFKRIGLYLFVAYPIGHFLLGFFDPFQCNDESGFHPIWSNLLEIGALIGVILYFLSKEKLEDELVKKIRLESMSISFLLSGAILLAISITSFASNVDAAMMFLIQLTIFLIIYHYQKRNFGL